MTIHVLHAGDGYLYLMRSVAVQDGRSSPGEALAAYYTAKGQPPGRWSGRGADRLGVGGVVTEEQMRALFGQGLHPDAERIRADHERRGLSERETVGATRLGRRFPQYGRTPGLKAALREAYQAHEMQVGRPLTDEERLFLRQQVAAARFRARAGRAPLDPVELEAPDQAAPDREAVAGYDLVFTPVKSVSVLWGIASDETRHVIYEAHRHAVDDALQWLEQNAALTRTGDVGQAQINTLGVTAAVFDHWDSRIGDPDLHTHVAISNKVQGPDEKWRSLDGRALFAAAVSLSERYNSRIEDELRARLGVQFVERPTAADRRPVREVEGMPPPLVEGFSKRRQGIENQYQELLTDYRQKHGHEPAASTRHHLYQQATLSNRPDKAGGRSLRQMVGEWRTEATNILGVSDACRTVEQQCIGRSNPAPLPSINLLADAALGVLAESRATWNVHHLRAEAHRQSRPYAAGDRGQLVEHIVEAASQPSRAIRLATGSTTAEPVELQRFDGEPVFSEHGAHRFTSAAILDAEQRIVSAARQTTRSWLSDSMLAPLVRASSRPKPLNAGQRALVRAFCGSGRLVQLGLAPAGAGKTTAMRVVAEAWTAAGHPIVGLAPSAVAASLLSAELGVPADTLAKFDVDQPAIRAGTMILVDEAGTAGTLMLDRIVTRAREAGAVVRLLGDDQQLGAVEAGGVLRQLAHEVGAVRMHEVVRFADPDEAAVTLRVRDGDATAVDFYLRHERVVAGTTVTMPDVAYGAWLADQKAERDSLLLAASGADVSALNARARADLVVAGRVTPDGVRLCDGNVAGVGDRVTTRRNNRLLAVHLGRDWVKNGDSWTVLSIQNDTLTVVHRGHRGQVTLPAEYVGSHVELDYARTIRRSQGMTVDHAHLLVEPHLTREDLYVGLSRARLGTHLYVATVADLGPDHLPDAAGATEQVLRAIISRSGAEMSASDTLRAVLANTESLRRMATEYEYALGVQVGDRYRVAAEAAHPGLTADPAWPSVAHRLHRLEATGHTVTEALHRADQMGTYSDAHSEAQVLCFRLDRMMSASSTEEARPLVPMWLAAAPPVRSEPRWRSYMSTRYDEMSERITGLVSEAAADPWTTRVGPNADRDEALRQIGAYRSVYGLAGEDPVGPEPDRRTRQHEAWTAASNALQRSHVTESGASPGAARLVQELAAEVVQPDGYCADVHAGTARHV